MGKKGGAGRVRVKQMGPKGMGAPVNPMAELNNIAPEDQIVFPPRPDSGVTHVWPMSATFTLNYKEGFSSIWPTYLDSTKTTRHGRRIAVVDAVPEPTVLDISEALQTMGIKHAIQPYKGLPADTKSRWDNPGRVLIDMEEAAEKIGSGCADGVVGAGASSSSEGFDADAVPDMDGILGGGSDKSGVEGNAKKALIREIARIIPTLPGRAQRLEAKKKQKELEDKKDKERAAKMVAAKSGGGGGAGGGGGSGTGGGSSKKKGKKKR